MWRGSSSDGDLQWRFQAGCRQLIACSIWLCLTLLATQALARMATGVPC